MERALTITNFDMMFRLYQSHVEAHILMMIKSVLDDLVKSALNSTISESSAEVVVREVVTTPSSVKEVTEPVEKGQECIVSVLQLVKTEVNIKRDQGEVHRRLMLRSVCENIRQHYSLSIRDK